MLGLTEVLRFRPRLPQRGVFRLEPLVFLPKSVVTEPTRLFARDSLDYTLGMGVDGGATLATLLGLPRHRSPRATEDGGGIANPGCHGYIQHGSEPPRSKLGQTWFINHEAHLLQSR